MDLLEGLNEPQRQAVKHVHGPLLVLAGAGSGKTRVITRRVANLIRQGVAPWNVLALTFTNKAAGEMRERVEALGTPRGTTVCTFHALCARLLRDLSAEAGLPTNFTIYDRDDQLKIVKEAVNRLNLKLENFPPSKIHAIISNSKNDLKTPQQYEQEAQGFLCKTAAKVYAEYERLLAVNKAMDFDDLLLRTAYLMKSRPDIRRQLAERFQYILIDEYQDTNRAQYIIAHGMAMEHENICATGDPDQSIYAWRGADIKNILEFERDYPNATVIRLEENYRSTRPILTAASHLIACNRMRKDKSLWTRREGGANVRVVYSDDEHAEANMVARSISEYHKGGGSYGDVAVFYRVNSLSRVMEEALRRGGIAYRMARGVEFYNRKEIKDVLAYLKLLVNPSDDLSCDRIINVPARAIGAATVNRLLEFAHPRGLSLLQACQQAAQSGLSAAAAKKAEGFSHMIDSLAAGMEGRPVRDILETVLKISGLEASYSGLDEDSMQARENVNELVSAAAEFDETSEGGTLADYLHLVSLVSDVDHMESGAGAVTLMTLHAAKGLEFPVVFVIGWEEGLLPFQREDESIMDRYSTKAQEKLEEERRLAFVGMTRAMDSLTISCAKVRMIRGKTTPQAASQFLSEIGTDFVTVDDLTTAAPRLNGAGRTSRGGFFADSEERSQIEAIFGGQVRRAAGGNDLDWMPDASDAPFPPEYENLKVGSRVKHSKFGQGKVVRLRQPWPETRAEILFDGVGPKTLVLAIARLTVLS